MTNPSVNKVRRDHGLGHGLGPEHAGQKNPRSLLHPLIDLTFADEHGSRPTDTTIFLDATGPGFSPKKHASDPNQFRRSFFANAPESFSNDRTLFFDAKSQFSASESAYVDTQYYSIPPIFPSTNPSVHPHKRDIPDSEAHTQTQCEAKRLAYSHGKSIILDYNGPYIDTSKMDETQYQFFASRPPSHTLHQESMLNETIFTNSQPQVSFMDLTGSEYLNEGFVEDVPVEEHNGSEQPGFRLIDGNLQFTTKRPNDIPIIDLREEQELQQQLLLEQQQQQRLAKEQQKKLLFDECLNAVVSEAQAFRAQKSHHESIRSLKRGLLLCEQADSACETAVRQNIASQIHAYAAESYFLLGDYDQAISSYVNAIGCDPLVTSCYLPLIRLFIQSGQLNNAHFIYGKYTEAIMDLQQNGDLPLHGEPNEGTELGKHLQNALEIEKGLKQAHDQKQFGVALTLCKQIIKISPSAVIYKVLHAKILRLMGNYTDALSEITQLKNEHPQNQDIFEEYVWCTYFSGDLEQCIQSIHAYTSEHRQAQTGILNEILHKAQVILQAKNLGNDYFKQKKYDNAISEYTRGLSADSKHMILNCILLSNRAAAYIARDSPSTDKNRIIEDCRQAISHDPSYLKVKLRLLRYLYSVHETSSAALLAKEIRDAHPADKDVLQKIQEFESRHKADLTSLEDMIESRFKKKTHYEVLGVKADAGDAEIKKAYHGLVRKWHPDRFATADDMQQIESKIVTRVVNEAYKVLSNSALRIKYDLSLSSQAATPQQYTCYHQRHFPPSHGRFQPPFANQASQQKRY